MAWLLTNSISLPDGPLTQWSSESADAIKRANAEIVAHHSALPPDDPGFIKPGDAPAGLPMPEPVETRAFIIKSMGETLPDALSLTVVNERIRAIVEELEPGFHQFFPVTVVLPDGSRDEGWWNMRACHRLDAIAFEECEDVYRYRPRPEDYPNWYYYRSNEGSRMKLVVRKDVIAGKAIWYDWRFQRFFASEDLGQRFIDAGVRGIRLPTGELGLSMHVSEI